MKKLISGVLSLCLLIQCGISASANEQISISASQNEDYYCEENISYGTNALNTIFDAEVAQYFSEIQESNDYELVAVASKTVCVEETIDANGNRTVGRLLTVNEVQNSSAVGEDTTTSAPNRYLSLYLVVYRDANYRYRAYGTADWKNGIYGGSSNPESPSSGYDCMGFTWGGNGELKQTSSSASGQYQFGQGSITTSKAASKSYSGVAWNFNEQNSFSFYADYIDCEVALAKTYSTVKNKETEVRLSYVHTYEDVSTSVSIGGGTSVTLPTISVSGTSKQWTIEVSVPGVKY